MKRLSNALLRRPGLLCTCAALATVLFSLFFTLISIPPDRYSITTSLTSVSVFLAYSSFLGFSGFAVVSYHLFTAMRRAELTETVQAIPSGYSRTQGYLARRVVLAAAVYALFLLALTQYMLIHANSGAPTALRRNFVYAVVLYGLLPAGIGVLWGFAGHFRMNKLLFGLLTFVAAFLASPIASELYISAGVLGSMLGGSRLGAAFQTAFGFFYRLVPVFDQSINVTYGLPVEINRWATAGFWILLILALALFQSKKGRWPGAACAVLCVPAAVFAVKSHSMGISGLYVDIPTVLRADRDGLGNYQYHTDAIDAPPFDVLCYTLDFTFTDMLHADATMDVSEQTLPEYVFTLYHGYTVSSVEDESGHPLRFSQERDRLTVYPMPNATVRAIRLHYSGWNNIYYSNWQGAYLPCFCYFYPVAGSHTIYTASDTAEASFFVTAPENCFLNLPRVGDGWSGTGRCLNLVSGIYRESSKENVSYIVPWEAEIQNIMPELRQAIARYNASWNSNYHADDIAFVIYSPTFNLPYDDRPNQSAVCGDTLFVAYSPYSPIRAEDVLPAFLTHRLSGGEIGYWYERMLNASASGAKLIQVFEQEFGTLQEGEYRVLPALSDELNSRREIGHYLGLAILRWGEETVVREIAAYMDGSTENDLQFAKTLWQEGVS